MTKDVTVSLQRVGVVLGAIAALIVLATAMVKIGDDRYTRREELVKLQGDIQLIKCAVRPNATGCPGSAP